jgi:hypothetical protein
MPKTEEKLIEEMCWIIYDWEKDIPTPPGSPQCKLLASAMYAAKSTLPKGSPRRVFVQDLAASLNRKSLILKEEVDSFNKLGYEYMEAPI